MNSLKDLKKANFFKKLRAVVVMIFTAPLFIISAIKPDQFGFLSWTEELPIVSKVVAMVPILESWTNEAFIFAAIVVSLFALAARSLNQALAEGVEIKAAEKRGRERELDALYGQG